MKRRFWFSVHSWLGVMLGLLLFVICWSGTIAVVSHEVDWLLDARTRAAPCDRPVSWGRLEASVRAAHPDVEAMTLHAPMYSRSAAWAVVDTPRQKMLRIYLDPCTGRVLGETSYFNVQRFFRSLHMSFFDFGSGRMWGYWFVGAFSIVLLVMAITPLVFYRRWWRGFLTLKTRRGARVFWSDAHKLAGVWSLVFGFLIALTGVWYLVEFFDVNLGYPELTPIEGTPADRPQRLDDVIAIAQANWPSLRITSVTPAENNWLGPVVHVDGEGDAVLVRDRANYLVLDPANGKILRRQAAADVGWPARWVDTADPLHFGDFAGLWSKVPWVVFGLLLSILPLTGAYLHVQRLRSASARSAWAGTGIAVGFTAVVLLIAVWAGWQEFLGYGPIIDGTQVPPPVSSAVIAFIAGWVLATLAVLAMWAWFVLRKHRVD
jgi:uncharacterized iron-regulated membrane protein